MSDDILVVGFYGTAVIVTVALALLANSRSIRTAAILIGGAWAFSIFTFFYLNPTGYFLVAVMLDTLLAYHFWRMARVEIFPAALCVILLFEISFIVFAEAAALAPFWTMFVLNRIFELTLLYLIGCSFFRIHIRRLQKNSDQPITGWRANFVVG